MAAWREKERWQRLCDGRDCPICARGKPLGVVAELAASYVTAGEDAPLMGYCCLVAKTHAVEIHDLPDPEAVAFWSDARRLSRALAELTRAVKLNCEIHGNTIPHLHMHFYPRYPGDPFESGPVDPRRAVGPVYGPGEYEAFIAGLRRALLRE